jgi:catechol 2,3-dioxygenase
MAECLLSALRSVELGVPDVNADAKFYADVWHLAPVAEREGAIYLRGTGAHHHILALHPRPRTELISITFSARSRADVGAVHRAVKARGGAAGDPAPVTDPGGGYGFTFRDPEGRVLRVIAEAQYHADAQPARDRPERLAHVVLNATDVAAAERYFLEVLGFKLSDRTARMAFLRNNRDHHSVALAHGAASTLNHIAFQMPDLDSVMRGAGRMKDNGWPIEWGVGRHGPGNNVFAYFLGPHDVPIEYTSEVDQVDDTYRVGGPDDWTWPPGRSDRWGVTGPPSERFHAAQKKIPFATDAVAP